MSEKVSLDWGMHAMPIEGCPFELARCSCLHAALVARDVLIDEDTLERFAAQLDVVTLQDIFNRPMGENCDTVPGDFPNGRDAANFALLFSLLQFGHGFRYELHRLCGRGASRTITSGARALHVTGDLSAARLSRLTKTEVQHSFRLPSDPALEMFAQQLHAVAHQAGTVLERLGLEDFASFCRQVLRTSEETCEPASTMIRQLVNHFPAFNDQATLYDGSRVLLLKKATLAIGELRRLAATHDRVYDFQDLHRAIAPVDNVIPAMLVFQGVLRLSPALYHLIQEQRAPLPRGPQEAELRAVALAACERIAAAAGGAFSPLDLGYYLWLSGKEEKARQFVRHHTKDTVFY